MELFLQLIKTLLVQKIFITALAALMFYISEVAKSSRLDSKLK